MAQYYPSKIVITGFNTDIEHGGVVYHVQTEDKGLDSPLILSLVYSGGEILASKRSPYEDLIASGFNEEALSQRLKRQHRLICAAINAGRIDELKRMGSLPDAVPTKAAPVNEPAPVDTDEFEFEFELQAVPEPPTQPSPGEELEFIRNSAEYEALGQAPEPPAQAAEFELVSNAEDYAVLAEQKAPATEEPAESVTSTSEDLVPESPAAEPAAEIEPPLPGATNAEKAAYMVYDSRRRVFPEQEATLEDGLVLSILEEEEFRAGETFNICIQVENRSRGKLKPLAGVVLSVKILGTSFRPLIYSVKTERDGVAFVSVTIPPFSTGRAAILIQAAADDLTIETRRVIHPSK